MLVFISGSDSFLAKTAIDQIKRKYLLKNPEGTELIEIDESTENPNWADLQAVPLFSSSRLVLIRRLGLMSKSVQQQVGSALSAVPDSTVVVIWDGKTIDEPILTTKLAAAAKKIDANTPSGGSLTRWINNRAKELGLDQAEVADLTQSGLDLWALETELRQRQTGLTTKSEQVKATEPFVYFNLLRRGNWEGVRSELAAAAKRGEPIELLIGSLAAAARKEITDKELKKKLAELLLDIDIGIKTGMLDQESAIALIVDDLPPKRLNRVQWEATWEETQS